jgi:hypothetical protein
VHVVLDGIANAASNTLASAKNAFASFGSQPTQSNTAAAQGAQASAPASGAVAGAAAAQPAATGASGQLPIADQPPITNATGAAAINQQNQQAAQQVVPPNTMKPAQSMVLHTAHLPPHASFEDAMTGMAAMMSDHRNSPDAIQALYQLQQEIWNYQKQDIELTLQEMG